MQFNYQRTRKHTIGKLVVMSLSTILPILLWFVVGYFCKDKYEEYESLMVYRLIILLIAEGLICLRIATYIRIIVSEEWATNYFISKRDERNTYIRFRSQTFSRKLMLYGETIAMIVTGFINQILFWTLGIIVICTVLTDLIAHFYFSRKI